MLEKSFCDVFKELRTEKNLSQDAIAKELDVSPALISKWENNQSTPAPEMLEYIADYFDISVDYLIGRTTDKRWYKSDADNSIRNEVYQKFGLMSFKTQKITAKSIDGIIKSMIELDKEYDIYDSDIPEEREEFRKSKNQDK